MLENRLRREHGMEVRLLWPIINKGHSVTTSWTKLCVATGVVRKGGVEEAESKTETEVGVKMAKP